MSSLTAVLFTGGESRRMGTDKATLLYQGEPLWSRQLRTLRAIAPDTIFLSARNTPPWCPPDVTVILDPPPTRGPLSGLAAALANIRTTHLLALAVDMPLMTPEHLCWLQTHLRLGCGVMPVHSGHSEPLCAIYPAQAAELATAAMNSHDVSLHSLVATLREKHLLTDCLLTEAQLPFYQNFNSPADLTTITKSSALADLS